MPHKTILTEVVKKPANAGTLATANTREEMVLEAFRLRGGEVNIDEIVEAVCVEQAQALEILWRLRRRGKLVRRSYEGRFALPDGVPI